MAGSAAGEGFPLFTGHETSVCGSACPRRTMKRGCAVEALQLADPISLMRSRDLSPVRRAL